MSKCAFARVRAAVVACAVFVGNPAAAQEAAPQPPAQAPPPPSGEATLPEIVVKTPAEAKPSKKAKIKAAAKKGGAPTGPAAGTPADAEAAAEANRPQSVAAPVKDYVAKISSSGTKTDTPLKETPQSITVVGREQMRDQGVQNLQEAIRYVPGVIADGFGYDSRGDYFLIRGIVGTIFLDGLRRSSDYYVNTTALEPYSLERVEVLRGPSSMLYGQTPTGGIINATSKLPSEIPYREIGVEYGSFEFKQVKLDATGTLTNDGKWLYRIVGLARDADTQVDFVENDRLMLAPSLTYRPTSATSITVLGNFRNDDSGSTQQFLPQIGTLTPNVNGRIVPRDTFVGEPSDYYDTEAESASLFVDHKFSEDLKLHHASRYAHTENGYKSTYAAILTPVRFETLNDALGFPFLDGSNAPFFNADQSEIARAVLLQETETDVFNSDTNLTGKFQTGWIDHKVTGGFDYMRFSTDMLTSGTLVDNVLTSSSVPPPFQPFLPFPLQPAFDIYNPQYGRSNYLLSLTSGPVSPDAIPLFARPEEVQIQSGLYIQDQLRLGPWIAVLGLRQDWLTIKQEGAPDEKEEATTGRAALMYEFSFGLTPYVSYSTSFMPLPGQPVGEHIYSDFRTWTPAGPIKGEQVEVGFKYQPNGIPFIINAAVYELTDKNQLVQPDFLFAAVQGADVNVRGFEIEAIGKAAPGLKVVAAYSYTDAKYEKYPELYPLPSGISAFMEGQPVDGVPHHLASFWAIYTFEGWPLRGLSFGAGVRYIGESESTGREISFDSIGTPIAGQAIHVTTPSYTLFDAMVAYDTPDWRWQLTGQNLEDEYYVTSCSAYRGDCGVGQARTITTSFTYRF